MNDRQLDTVAEIVCGTCTAEDIARREGVSVEEVRTWVRDAFRAQAASTRRRSRHRLASVLGIAVLSGAVLFWSDDAVSQTGTCADPADVPHCFSAGTTALASEVNESFAALAARFPVSSTDIANGAVATEDIAPNAVTAAEIASSAVGTSELATKSVTNAKLGATVSFHFFQGTNASYRGIVGAKQFCTLTNSIDGCSLGYANGTWHVDLDTYITCAAWCI